MKISTHVFALLLVTLALSGCATSSCKKNAAETPAPEKAAIAVAAPVTPVVTPAAPVVSEEPASKKIPAAVMK